MQEYVWINSWLRFDKKCRKETNRKKIINNSANEWHIIGLSTFQSDNSHIRSLCCDKLRYYHLIMWYYLLFIQISSMSNTVPTEQSRLNSTSHKFNDEIWRERKKYPQIRHFAKEESNLLNRRGWLKRSHWPFSFRWMLFQFELEINWLHLSVGQPVKKMKRNKN